MTGTQNLQGPAGGNVFNQIGRWLMLGAATAAGLVMLFFSAAFALVLVGGIALVALVAVAVFWIRAKLTGRPFGPRAMMDAQMEELRKQMGSTTASFGAPFAAAPADETDGPVIDAHQTPEGWTVER